MPEPIQAMDPVFILICNQTERVIAEIEKGARFLENRETLENLHPDDEPRAIGNTLAIILLNN